LIFVLALGNGRLRKKKYIAFPTMLDFGSLKGFRSLLVY
jgi:hypothetical protein